MLNARQATETAMAMHYPRSEDFNYDKEKYLNALREYRKAQEDVTKQFRAYLEYTYPQKLSPEILQQLWDTAFSRGRPFGGYRQVETLYEEFLDIIQKELNKL